MQAMPSVCILGLVCSKYAHRCVQQRPKIQPISEQGKPKNIVGKNQNTKFYAVKMSQELSDLLILFPLFSDKAFCDPPQERAAFQWGGWDPWVLCPLPVSITSSSLCCISFSGGLCQTFLGPVGVVGDSSILRCDCLGFSDFPSSHVHKNSS